MNKSPADTLQEIESFNVAWHDLDQQLSSLFLVTKVIVAGVRGLRLGGKSGLALKSDVAVLFPWDVIDHPMKQVDSKAPIHGLLPEQLERISLEQQS